MSKRSENRPDAAGNPSSSGPSNSGSSSSDPFAKGLDAFASDLRKGSVSIAAALEYCLDRIDQFEPKLQCFQTLGADNARATAAALDDLLASGTDLGPLMGVPIAVKDIIAVRGFPTTNGSLHDAGLPGENEGTIVEQLRQAGCIIVGKTKTVEFALGATGMNSARGTPWNPWDLTEHRIPGGSSSGSAVAVAAGFVAFALGTDTGGSVRIPACFNGLYGHKTTVGLWPTDGVFPLSPTLDSIGPLCRTARDAAIVHGSICKVEAPLIETPEANDSDDLLAGLALGIPQDVFQDNLDETVSKTFNTALQKLEAAGATLIPCESPEAHEKATVFPAIVPAELLSTLTRDGFASAAAKMDPVTEQRARAGLDVAAIDYFSAQKRIDELEQIARERLEGLDGWLSPTCPFVPLVIDTFSNPAEHKRSLLASQNTQPANLMGMCASSLPIHHLAPKGKDTLPVGLHLMMPGDCDEDLLGLSQLLQLVLGTGNLPKLD